MEDQVLEFIKRRFPIDCNWCNGNCYWFAAMLHMRFPNLKIWLFPIENHFMVGDREKFYDWNGIRFLSDCEEVPIEWDKVEQFDSLYFQHIVRDCIQ